MTVVAVILICGLLAAGGWYLHQWSTNRIKNPPAEPDLRDLADPSRWPAPPPSANGADRDPGGSPDAELP